MGKSPINTSKKTNRFLISLIFIAMAAGACMHAVAYEGDASQEDANASGQNSLFQALTGGKIDLNLHYRFEHVDDDFVSGGTSLKDAKASTFRTALGYTTSKFFNFDARLAFQDVRTVGPDDFNDATGRANAKTTHALVADPSDTDVLESYIGFSGIPHTQLKAGRQMITYRKAPFHRFIGTILWRQNWQVFDAFSAVNTYLPDTTISYAYIWNVNRIFSEEAVDPFDNFDSNSHFVNVKYDGFPLGKFEAYTYLLDFDNGAAFSTDTFGIRFGGGYPLTDRIKALYVAEYADQSDSNNNPNDIDADYIHGSLGANFKINNIIDSLTLKFSYEQLSGDGGADRFITILGTNHAFQGWADRFLITPGDGIEDFFVTAIIKAYGIKFVIDYHDLSSDNDSYDYGDELGLLA
ncbi:MAG: hypothetical protein V3V89_04760, partial [Gammaproteobacteria bacterium]